jgi:bacillithiol biosynthesis deacetylase BshB1
MIVSLIKPTTYLDIIAFGAHPDDVEASVGGTIAKSAKQGFKAGIVDLTSGDNSETAEGKTRIGESVKSAKILGANMRINLEFKERNFINLENEDKIAEILRKYKPKIVMIPYWDDRHYGHRDASFLLERAIQSAKYRKILPKITPHKVMNVLYYMMHYDFKPSFVFDISETFKIKMKALFCHKSQLFLRSKKGGYTKRLLDQDFIEAWTARSRWLGYISGFKYGEAFFQKRSPGINNLFFLSNLYR